jgi:hypothetical protein
VAIRKIRPCLPFQVFGLDAIEIHLRDLHFKKPVSEEQILGMRRFPCLLCLFPFKQSGHRNDHFRANHRMDITAFFTRNGKRETRYLLYRPLYCYIKVMHRRAQWSSQPPKERKIRVRIHQLKCSKRHRKLLYRLFFFKRHWISFDRRPCGVNSFKFIFVNFQFIFVKFSVYFC